MSKAPEIVEAIIPPEMLVQCPKFRFDFRHATHCATCPELHGILQISKDGSWDQMYRISCRHPIARRTSKVNEE